MTPDNVVRLAEYRPNHAIVSDVARWMQVWADRNPEVSGVVRVHMSKELLATLEERGIDLAHAVLPVAEQLGFEDVKVWAY